MTFFALMLKRNSLLLFYRVDQGSFNFESSDSFNTGAFLRNIYFNGSFNDASGAGITFEVHLFLCVPCCVLIKTILNRILKEDTSA